MFKKLKQLKYELKTEFNDLKFKLGLISETEHLSAKLQEDFPFYWDQFRDFFTEQDIVKTLGQNFDTSTSDSN